MLNGSCYALVMEHRLAAAVAAVTVLLACPGCCLVAELTAWMLLDTLFGSNKIMESALLIVADTVVSKLSLPHEQLEAAPISPDKPQHLQFKPLTNGVAISASKKGSEAFRPRNRTQIIPSLTAQLSMVWQGTMQGVAGVPNSHTTHPV
jgi:hypothetical protein